MKRRTEPINGRHSRCIENMGTHVPQYCKELQFSVIIAVVAHSLRLTDEDVAAQDLIVEEISFFDTSHFMRLNLGLRI